MKFAPLLITSAILLAIASISAAAQDCSTDGYCNMECIDNTIDEFDSDCGIAETELYGSSAVEQISTAPIDPPQEPEKSNILPSLAGPCSKIKDGVCETTCEGVDLDCLCGDFECQAHENAATCPIDCRYEKNRLCVIVRDNYCDEECRPFDADCTKQAIYQSTKDIEAQYNLPEQTVQTTLALIFVTLCAVVIYLMHKAYELKKRKS